MSSQVWMKGALADSIVDTSVLPIGLIYRMRYFARILHLSKTRSDFYRSMN